LSTGTTLLFTLPGFTVLVMNKFNSIHVEFWATLRLASADVSLEAAAGNVTTGGNSLCLVDMTQFVNQNLNYCSKWRSKHV
jgi:hypothetical protein